LSEVKVKEVNVGTSLPLFSRPMLKDLTAEGDASMEIHVGFVGAVRVTVETVATLSLGSRSYSTKLVLAVILRELEGTLLVKMKKPPSNRIWFGFTAPPACKIDIEPVVSSRQIKWSLVTGPIESRIRELVSSMLSSILHSSPLIDFSLCRLPNPSFFLTWTTSPSSTPVPSHSAAGSTATVFVPRASSTRRHHRVTRRT
jgi:hypothetical protein